MWLTSSLGAGDDGLVARGGAGGRFAPGLDLLDEIKGLMEDTFEPCEVEPKLANVCFVEERVGVLMTEVSGDFTGTIPVPRGFCAALIDDGST